MPIPRLNGQYSRQCALSIEVPKTPDEIAAARNLPTRQLQQILRNDLDAIVLMAIRKEPEQRYRSAEQFRDDLHRYLKSMPVRAQRDSWLYRADKFVQRHPALLTIATGVPA